MKILKYILYYIIIIILLLGYWGFVKIFFNNLPLYNYTWLDYLSGLGLFSILYMIINNFRKELLKFLEL